MLFWLFKISIRQNRTLPFCNKDRLIADDTKEYELRRQRFDNATLNPNELALAEELEMEQVFVSLKKVINNDINVCSIIIIFYYSSIKRWHGSGA